MADTYPTIAELSFPVEDGIECGRLVEILERIESVHHQGALPLRIVSLDMTDHFLKIVLSA